jgi:hypothetical protein
MKENLPTALRDVFAIAQPYASHLFAIGIFAVLGIGFGLIQANSSPEKATLSDRWVLPVVSLVEGTTISAEEIGSRFWTEQPRTTKAKVAPEPVKKIVPWAFVGTIDQGSSRVAVIVTETGKTTRLAVGQQLPDGSTITEIAEGGLSFDKDGAIRTLKLFLEAKSE